MELLAAVLLIVLGAALGFVVLEVFFLALLKGIHPASPHLLKERKYSRM